MLKSQKKSTADVEDSDDCYPSTLRPWWRRREHEIDILLAAIAGAVVTALILWKLLRS